jgi:hypothetical protein
MSQSLAFVLLHILFFTKTECRVFYHEEVLAPLQGAPRGWSIPGVETQG